jgi:hypothetical protein
MIGVLIHGESKPQTSEYMAWAGMIKRCYNPRTKKYPGYGGRGIAVCPEWRESYQTFLSDMGRKPTPKHSLDRYPNNDGNYEPGNCRWGTPEQQMQNTRYNRLLTINGVTHCHSEWARRLGVGDTFLRYRLERGMAAMRAINAQPGLERVDR